MKGYKAFEKGLVCRGKQYAENTEFKENEAIICKKGMHFCENPFDVFDYYPMVNDRLEMPEFAEVEALDEPVTDDGIKYCSKHLKVGVKLSFGEIVKAFVELQVKKTISENSSGDCAQISSSGNCARIGSSGDCARIGSSGDCARIGSSGYGAQIGSSGSSTRISSSGNCARIGSSGNCARIGSSGDCAQIGSSGYGAQIGSSGSSTRISSSGYGARIGSSGGSTRISSSGDNSVICCAGHGCAVKAKKGSWITLAEWENNKPICVKTEFVDGERIKEDTIYMLKNGEFVEV